MKTRIPELDGIRGMAILLVLIWHYVVGTIGETSSPLLRLLSWSGMQTWSGVDLFFVLSGFLIGGILVDAKGSDSYFRTFYVRRVFRILPIYVLICAGYFAPSGRHSPARSTASTSPRCRGMSMPAFCKISGWLTTRGIRFSTRAGPWR